MARRLFVFRWCVPALVGMCLGHRVALAQEPETPRAIEAQSALQLELTGQALVFTGTSCSRDGDVGRCSSGPRLLGAQAAVLYRPRKLFAVGVVGGGLFELSGAGVASSTGGSQTDRLALWHAGFDGRLYPIPAPPSWFDAWIGAGLGLANATDIRTDAQDGVVTARSSVDRFAFHAKAALGVELNIYRGFFVGAQAACSFLAFDEQAGDGVSGGRGAPALVPPHTEFHGHLWAQLGLLTLGYRQPI